MARELLANREAQPVFYIDMDSDFIKHIQKCSEEVAKWPEWKRQGSDATQFTATAVPDFKKLASELVENLVDCGVVDDSSIKQYLKWTEKTCRSAMLAQPVSQGYKLPPHAYRELVNSLRDTAVKYSGTDQLRERLNTTLSQFIEPDHPHTRTTAPDSV